MSIRYNDFLCYSVCQFIATVPPQKSRAHLEIALNPRLLQLFPCLGPQGQVTSVPM